MNGHKLQLLASLNVLLDERNVTRAAERLGISQPALSAQLGRLRDVFGDQLLTPAASGRGMVLTPRGLKLKGPLRQALQQLDEVVSRPARFDPLESERTFAIGGNDNAIAIIAPRLIQALQRCGARQLRLVFRAFNPARLADQLETGEIDIALVSHGAIPNGMSNQPLIAKEFMMAQRKGHPRGTRRPSLKEYAALDHVVVSSDGGGFRSFIDDILKAKGSSRRVAVSVQYYSVVPAILHASDFVCTLPARFIARYADMLAAVALPFDAGRFTLHSAWHARFDNDPGHAWLRSQLAASAKE